MTDALVPVLEGDERRNALLRAVGFDKLSEPQRELALAIATRYNLDVMLKHLVMIDGKPYITRDGLLHVAHASNVFDGIEVTQPESDGKYWRAKATVYRKDMSRPFTYPGRYPVAGGNQKYAEEMAIKVAEVMTLRRAFDVSAPTIEERWDEMEADVETPPAPSSLVDKIAAQAAAIQQPEGLTETDEKPAGDDTVVEPETAPLSADLTGEGDEAQEALIAEIVAADSTDPDDPDSVAFGSVGNPEAPATTSSGPTLDDFKAWAVAFDRDLIKAVAKRLFPEGGAFADLSSDQLSQIITEVETESRLRAEADARLAEQAVDQIAESTSGVTLCGDKSPFGESTCTMDAGHKGPHRAGLRETW